MQTREFVLPGVIRQVYSNPWTSPEALHTECSMQCSLARAMHRYRKKKQVHTAHPHWGATPATETQREQHGFGCSPSTSVLADSVMPHWKQKRGQKFSLKFPTPLHLEVWDSWCPSSSSVHYFPFEFNQEICN